MAGLLTVEFLEDAAETTAKFLNCIFQKYAVDFLKAENEAMEILMTNCSPTHLNAITKNHPGFSIIARDYSEKLKNRNEKAAVFKELYSQCSKIYQDDEYSNDVELNIIMSAIVGAYAQDKGIELGKEAFMPFFEWHGVKNTPCNILLLAVSLWFYNYGNFRELLQAEYCTLIYINYQDKPDNKQANTGEAVSFDVSGKESADNQYVSFNYNAIDYDEIESAINNEILKKSLKSNNRSGMSKNEDKKGNSSLSQRINILRKCIDIWTKSSLFDKFVLASPLIALILFVFDIGEMKFGLVSVISSASLLVIILLKSDDISSLLWAIPNSLFSLGVIVGCIISKNISTVLLFGVCVLILSMIQWITSLDKTNSKQLIRIVLIYSLFCNTILAFVTMLSGIKLGIGVFVFGFASALYLFSQTVLYVLQLSIEDNRTTRFIYSIRQFRDKKEESRARVINDD